LRPSRVILGVRVHAFNRIDRSSGLVLAAVAALTLAGIITVVLAESSEVAAESSTPRGIVATYVRAIQAGDADKAWSLLNQNGTAPAPANGSPTAEPHYILSQDEFRQQVRGNRRPTPPGVRIVEVSQSSDWASVQLAITNASANPLTGVSGQQVSVYLVRQAGSWQITSDPSPWAFQ
jgi:hypothetical protein